MITYTRKTDTADVSVVIRIIDSTTGAPVTSVTDATSGLVLKYRREGGTLQTITDKALSPAALDTAHDDGGFLHIENGYYRLDLPDVACAAGATGVLVQGVVTGMVVIGCYIQLVAYNPFDTVRLGLTAMPNVASGSAGALIVSGTGTAALSVTSGLVTLAGVTHTGAVIPTVTTLTNLPAITSNWLTAAGIAATALNGKGDWNIGKTGYTLTATTGLGNQTANITGTLSGSVGSIASGGITEASFATTAGSFAPMGIVDQGTMQTGSTSTTAVLRSALNLIDNLLIGATIVVTGGTGAGQARTITDWTQSTDTATVDAWVTTPDNTSTYKVFAGSPSSASELNAIRDKINERTVLRGSVSTGSSTTSITTSALSPATTTADQLKNRVVIFDNDTSTAALRGQVAQITASTASATPTLTVSTMVATPASGDLFSVV